MDRTIVYPAQLPAAEDFLSTQRETLRDLARLSQALTGGSPVVDGVGCVPTQPTSMAVYLSGGTCFWPTVMDGSPFGVLPAELSPAMKIGGYAGETLPLPAPTTPGTEVAYLLQASFAETDAEPEVLDYYNAANPAQPLSGPANSGAQQFTKRIARMVLSAKAGAPAPVGQAQAPAADPGYVPLWVVTVPAGATSIVSGMIAGHPSAPRFRSRLTTAMTVAEMGAYATAAALAAEAAARSQSDSSEAAARAALAAALDTHVNNLIAAINGANSARASGDASLAAAINGEVTQRAAGEAAHAASINDLYSRLGAKQDASAFGFGVGGSGWYKLPGGLIIQWGSSGSTDVAYATSLTASFPMTFPNTCLQAVASPYDAGGGSYNVGVISTGFTNSYMDCALGESNPGTIQNVGYRFIAIGF